MTQRTGSTILALAAFAVLAAAPQLSAQSQQQQTPPPAQQAGKPSAQTPAAGTTPAPVAIDPKEEAAYKALYDAKPSTPAELDAQIQAGLAFIKSYPASRYLALVYARLSNDYYTKRDIDKMYDMGQKAIALNGDDVDILTLIGWVIPRTNSQAPDYGTKLVQAIQYDKHALELLPTLPKPPGLTDDQFAKIKSSAATEAHSGLGIAYFREEKFADSAAELQQAVNGNANPDPTDYYVMGLALQNTQKFADAEKAFDSCAQINSQLQDRCKQSATAAKAKAATQPQTPKP